jgi:hypothetical protein
MNKRRDHGYYNLNNDDNSDDCRIVLFSVYSFYRK